MAFRLLAVDLDGTLFGDDLVVSPAVRAALAELPRHGVKLTLASGRGFPSMRRWVRELGVTVPVIAYQGAVVARAEDGRPLLERTFPRTEVRVLAAFADEHDLALHLYVGDAMYTRALRYPPAFYEKWFGLPCHVVGDLQRDLPGDPFKALYAADGDLLDRLAPALRRRMGDRLQTVRSHRLFLEALAPGVTKGSALAWLAGHLGLPRQEVLAVGDAGNDAAMLAWAGLGVAMGNGSPEARQAADVVAPPVERDGLAEVIARYVLREGM